MKEEEIEKVIGDTVEDQVEQLKKDPDKAMQDLFKQLTAQGRRPVRRMVKKSPIPVNYPKEAIREPEFGQTVEFEEPDIYQTLEGQGEDFATIQEQTKQTIVMSIYNLLSSPNPEIVTQLYNLIRTLALRLHEYVIVKELEDLFYGVKVTDKHRIPLPVLEFIYIRDKQVGYSPNKGYQGRQIKLADVIVGLAETKARFFDLFTKMAIEHNFEVRAQPPSLGEEGGMPEL